MEKLDYFWETEQYFRKFLSNIFKDNNYKTKFSLTGNGIYNLIWVNNKIYELKYTQTTKMGQNDSHSIDADKKYIIDTIVNNLQHNNYTIFGGKYITFTVANKWIAKVEIIKKMKMPD